MKIVALCNSEGEITSLASMPDGGSPVSFQNPDPRQQEIVIEAPDITADMSATEVLDRLHEIRNRRRVDITKKTFVAK
jgi:hypothetical protein